MKTPENTELKIIKMWNDGMTSSEIAEQTGMTRAAVMGKVYRLVRKGLLSKKKVNVTDITLSKASNPIQQDNNKVKKVRRVKPSYLAKKFEPPPKGGLSIMNLKENSCRYILNDGLPKNYVYCGKRKKVGAYCEDHARLCYIPSVLKPKDKIKNLKYELRRYEQ